MKEFTLGSIIGLGVCIVIELVLVNLWVNI